AVVAFNQDAVSEFQRTVHHKQDFLRRAVLDHRVLKKNVPVFMALDIAVAVAIAIAITITIAQGAAEFDGNPHRCSFRKKLRQAAYDAWFERTSSCLMVHS